MVKRWHIYPHDPQRIAALQHAAGIPAVIAQLLISRGICDPGTARLFLDPRLSHLRDPEQLPGCAQASQRIHEALRAGRRIVVYGDYDVDGITGTSLLCQCLRMLGGNVGYYIPHRLEEGYGLNHEAVRRLASEKPSCSSSTVESPASNRRTARECGLELIVTDHHEPGPGCPTPPPSFTPTCPARTIPSPV